MSVLLFGIARDLTSQSVRLIPMDQGTCVHDLLDHV